MQLPLSDQLNISAFSNLFNDTSACYKFFWFQAIIEKILAGKSVVTFDELINEMISMAWYMVSEYHLNLSSVTDNVEEAVKRLQEIHPFVSSEKKETIIAFLEQCNDQELHRIKAKLINNDPYRLQASLLKDFRSQDWNVGNSILIEHINTQRDHLIYYFDAYNSLDTKIIISPKWIEYIVENQAIIKGWINYNLVNYLQRRNPNVPGIIDKISAPIKPKLEKVKSFWRIIIKKNPLHEIYQGEELHEKNISIDHFVPWSYVAHDELWNLHPTTKNINSSKSNHLPDWDVYFKKYAEIEYLSYNLIFSDDEVRKSYENCAKVHLNSDDVKWRLYRQGLSRQQFFGELQEIVEPVYLSAKNAGFSTWTAR